MDIQCSVFIAASLDGFIARPDGDIEWLHRPEYECSRLNGVTYDEFMATVDALVMGRNTFDKVLSFPEWPYANTPVFVLSRQGVSVPPTLKGKVQVLSGAPVSIVEQLSARGFKHLYIDGGQTIQRRGTESQLGARRVCPGNLSPVVKIWTLDITREHKAPQPETVWPGGIIIYPQIST